MPDMASPADRLAPYRERRALLSARYPSWIAKTMDAHLADVAAKHPTRPLILTDDVTLSYADIVERSERIAKGLRRLGVRAGDRVALVLANVPEFAPLAFAIWRLGAAAIPVNYLFRAKELAYVIGQSDCRLVVTMSSFRKLVFARAGGLSGNGCVGEYHSPGTLPFGTGRSSTPNTGFPFVRSRMNM